MAVEFEDKSYTADAGNPQSFIQGGRPSFMGRMLIKTGIVKNEKQAQYVLIFFLIIILLITGFVIFTFLLPENRVYVDPVTNEVIYPHEIL